MKIRERIIYLLATRIICVDEGIKRMLMKSYGAKSEICRVIPSGVNTHIFKPLDKLACRRKLNLNIDHFYVGFVGSFQSWQGLDLLIEAMNIARNKGLNMIKCVFVGGGNLMYRLKQMTIKNNLQEYIIFMGRLEHGKIPMVLNSFDICYLCRIGLKFGFSPLKLFEYLACAKPIIASKVEGVSEIIEKGDCGYLFNPDDVESLASRIIESYRERNRLPELGNNGRRFIENRFSWEKIASKVQRVLEEAAGQK